MVANDRVFVPGGVFGGLDGYDATTGQRLWFRSLGQEYNWLPAADEDFVYVYNNPQAGLPGSLLTLNATNGAIVKNIADPNASISGQAVRTPVLDGRGRAFVTVPSSSFSLARLVAFDVNGGAIDWEIPLIASEFVTDGELLYVVSLNSILEIRGSDGTTIRSWQASQPLDGSPLLTDSHVIVSTNESTLAIGRTSWNVEWSLGHAGRLSMGDGILLVSNREGVTAFVAVPEPACAIIALTAILAALRCQVRSRNYFPVSGSNRDAVLSQAL